MLTSITGMWCRLMVSCVWILHRFTLCTGSLDILASAMRWSSSTLTHFLAWVGLKIVHTSEIVQHIALYTFPRCYCSQFCTTLLSTNADWLQSMYCLYCRCNHARDQHLYECKADMLHACKSTSRISSHSAKLLCMCMFFVSNFATCKALLVMCTSRQDCCQLHCRYALTTGINGWASSDNQTCTIHKLWVQLI